MFYSNGCLFLDNNNQELINGDSLNSSDIDYGVFCPEYGYSGYQNMICIPDSNEDSIYHVFISAPHIILSQIQWFLYNMTDLTMQELKSLPLMHRELF